MATTATTSSPNNQDWFLMTGDLIINLRSTKTGDPNRHLSLNGGKNFRKKFSTINDNFEDEDDDGHTILDNNQNKVLKQQTKKSINNNNIDNEQDDCIIIDDKNLEKNLEDSKETNIDSEVPQTTTPTTPTTNGPKSNDDIDNNNKNNNNNNNTYTISSLASTKISKNSLSSISSGNVSSGIVYDDDNNINNSTTNNNDNSSPMTDENDQKLSQQQIKNESISSPKSLKPPSSNCSSDYQHFSFFDNHNEQLNQHQLKLEQDQLQQQTKEENSYENIGDCMFKSQESNLYNQISDDDDDDGDYCRSIDELSIESENSSLLYYSTPTKFQNSQKQISNNNNKKQQQQQQLQQQQQCIDQASASRLAKRLYNLEGFKKSDVARHLSKNNEFCRTVAEEYLKLFNFTGQKLDQALRYFLSHFHLIGETHERERVLVYFSKRYYECNVINDNVSDSLTNGFKSIDSIHTLTCALMLLNTDLHDRTIQRKMTCSNFILNLTGMNDGDDYPNHLLKYLYYSIKNNPLGWIDDDEDDDDNNNENGDEIDNGDGHNLPIKSTKTKSNVFSKITTISKSISSPYATLPRKFNQQLLTSSSSMMATTAGTSAAHKTGTLNPFVDIPNPLVAIEYKKGYIRRKCCYDSNGRKTSIGKRSWKLFYATLRDLVLYLHKDENGFRKSQLQESFANSIRIHHSIASKADDYPKKKFVFRLITADYAEYLFETSDSKELQSWIETINTTAASLSAPTLPMAVSSDSRKFKKEIFPVSHTKLSLREQLKDQENKLLSLQKDMEQLLEKSCQNFKYRKGFMEKETYLQHEIKRYRVYVSCLRKELNKLPSLIQSAAVNDLKQQQQQQQQQEQSQMNDDYHHNNHHHHLSNKHNQKQQYHQDDQHFDYRTATTSAMINESD